MSWKVNGDVKGINFNIYFKWNAKVHTRIRCLLIEVSEEWVNEFINQLRNSLIKYSGFYPLLLKMWTIQ